MLVCFCLLGNELELLFLLFSYFSFLFQLGLLDVYVNFSFILCCLFSSPHILSSFLSSHDLQTFFILLVASLGDIDPNVLEIRCLGDGNKSALYNKPTPSFYIILYYRDLLAILGPVPLCPFASSASHLAFVLPPCQKDISFSFQFTH
jgi:hypothetical protein